MLKVHFLNVGHGDCTIIEHDSGNITMIDINNCEIQEQTATEVAEEIGFSHDYLHNRIEAENLTPEDILKASNYRIPTTNPLEFFNNRFSDKTIFRYIQTHPDMDHMSGLSALTKSGISILNFWDTDNNKIIEDFVSAQDEEDWNYYQEIRGNKHMKVLNLFAGHEGHFWNKHPIDPTHVGDGIYILAPTPELRDNANNDGISNAHSYVLEIRYGNYKIIMGGDATESVWEAIYLANNLKCNILKASHHGRLSGYYEPAVKEMNPEYTIVSVGKKPDTDSSDLYKKYSGNVWSTRWKGNIHLEVNDDGTQAVIDSEYNQE